MSATVSSAFTPSDAQAALSHLAAVGADPFPGPHLLYSPWQRRTPSVVAKMGYLSHSDGSAYTYMYEPPSGIAQQNCEFELVPVSIADARHLASPPHIDLEGFELWDAPTSVHDFLDAPSVTSTYYAETADLVKRATGATRVLVFDHQIRKREPGRPALAFGRSGDGSNPGAVGRVHVDYSEATGIKRLNLVLNDQKLSDAVNRFAIVNVWRSIKGPVLDTPLAVCDARTVGASDLACCEIRYQTRSGEIYLLRHSARHRWHYYSAMDRHEALIFKQYDSRVNGVSRFTPHAAFDHPEATEATPLRESIEVRCLAIFD